MLLGIVFNFLNDEGTNFFNSFNSYQVSKFRSCEA